MTRISNEREHEGDPARGVMNGLVLSTALWTMAWFVPGFLLAFVCTALAACAVSGAEQRGLIGAKPY